VLKRIDFGLELAGWTLALAFVILLFAGPHVIAEDKAPKPAVNTAGAAPGAGQSGGGGAAAGKAVFTSTCGSCHTLSKAGTSGSVGPNLDDVSLDAAAIEDVVHGGRGTMPSFDGKLSDADIAAVAAFVAGN
jgi:cytochrome c6